MIENIGSHVRSSQCWMLMVYFLVAIPYHFVVYAVIDECHNGNGFETQRPGLESTNQWQRKRSTHEGDYANMKLAMQ